MLGCSKQNVSYWELHADNTQARSSIVKVIHKAAELFELDSGQAEALANSAAILDEINDVLEKMGLPLLMTRLK